MEYRKEQIDWMCEELSEGTVSKEFSTYRVIDWTKPNPSFKHAGDHSGISPKGKTEFLGSKAECEEFAANYDGEAQVHSTFYMRVAGNDFDEVWKRTSRAVRDLGGVVLGASTGKVRGQTCFGNRAYDYAVNVIDCSDGTADFDVAGRRLHFHEDHEDYGRRKVGGFTAEGSVDNRGEVIGDSHRFMYSFVPATVEVSA